MVVVGTDQEDQGEDLAPVQESLLDTDLVILLDLAQVSVPGPAQLVVLDCVQLSVLGLAL